MEYLNRIELTGIVGSVRHIDFASGRCARLALVTNYAYTAEDGTPVIESTWHNIMAFSSEKITCLDRIAKGSRLHVVGRLVSRRYIGQDGCERLSFEVRASRMELLDGSEPLQNESDK